MYSTVFSAMCAQIMPHGYKSDYFHSYVSGDTSKGGGSPQGDGNRVEDAAGRERTRISG